MPKYNPYNMPGPGDIHYPNDPRDEIDPPEMDEDDFADYINSKQFIEDFWEDEFAETTYTAAFDLIRAAATMPAKLNDEQVTAIMTLVRNLGTKIEQDERLINLAEKMFYENLEKANDYY